jgi:uncharacterized radical SAM superfamily protein
MFPHIICGLRYGRLGGEKKAVEMNPRFKGEQVFIVKGKLKKQSVAFPVIKLVSTVITPWWALILAV